MVIKCSAYDRTAACGNLNVDLWQPKFYAITMLLHQTLCACAERCG